MPSSKSRQSELDGAAHLNSDTKIGIKRLLVSWPLRYEHRTESDTCFKFRIFMYTPDAFVTYYGAVAIKMLHSTCGTFMRKLFLPKFHKCLENHCCNQNSAKVELLVDKTFRMKPCLSGSAWLYIWLFNSYLPASLA